jgi:hypothetical protein
MIQTILYLLTWGGFIYWVNEINAEMKIFLVIALSVITIIIGTIKLIFAVMYEYPTEYYILEIHSWLQFFAPVMSFVPEIIFAIVIGLYNLYSRTSDCVFGYTPFAMISNPLDYLPIFPKLLIHGGVMIAIGYNIYTGFLSRRMYKSMVSK